MGPRSADTSLDQRCCHAATGRVVEGIERTYSSLFPDYARHYYLLHYYLFVLVTTCNTEITRVIRIESKIYRYLTNSLAF